MNDDDLWSGNPPPPPPPPSSKSKKKYRKFSFLITNEQYQFLKEASSKSNTPMAEFVRSLVTMAMMGGLTQPQVIVRRRMMMMEEEMVMKGNLSWQARTKRKNDQVMNPERMKAHLELINELKGVLEKRKQEVGHDDSKNKQVQVKHP